MPICHVGIGIVEQCFLEYVIGTLHFCISLCVNALCAHMQWKFAMWNTSNNLDFCCWYVQEQCKSQPSALNAVFHFGCQISVSGQHPTYTPHRCHLNAFSTTLRHASCPCLCQPPPAVPTNNLPATLHTYTSRHAGAGASPQTSWDKKAADHTTAKLWSIWQQV